jgi:hypothetical protein
MTARTEDTAGLFAVIAAFCGKRGDRSWFRDIHTRAAHRAVNPTGMLDDGGDRPELTETLGALHINDMNQMKTLIVGFKIA